MFRSYLTVSLIFSAVLVVLPFSLCFSSDAPFKISSGFGLESFKWQEFENGDDQLLSETGPRFIVKGDISRSIRADSLIDMGARIKGYVGTVFYDGQTQDRVPLESDTQYKGFDLELYSTLPVFRIANQIPVRFEGVLGFETWQRKIKSSVDIAQRTISGVVEKYEISYARTGFVLKNLLKRQQVSFRFGLKLPLTSKETIDILDLELEPKMQSSFYGSVSARFTPKKTRTRLVIEGYYDSFRFNASDIVSTPDLSVAAFQPKSSMDMVGILFSASF